MAGHPGLMVKIRYSLPFAENREGLISSHIQTDGSPSLPLQIIFPAYTYVFL